MQSEANKNITIDIYQDSCHIYSYNTKNFETFLHIRLETRFENHNFLKDTPPRFRLKSEIINNYLW